MNKIKSILFYIIRKVVRPLSGFGLGNVEPFSTLYRLISKATIPETQRQIRINGFDIIVRMGGKWGTGGIAGDLIYNGEYEPMTTRVFKHILKPDMRVIDVGANVGYFTLLSASIVGNKGRVYSFEPEQKNFNELLSNIELNGYKNVTANRKAVDSKNGIAQFSVSRFEPGRHSLIADTMGGKIDKVDVETIRLDDAVKGKIDLIKTDTEGNEFGVIQGAEKLLRQKDIKLIVEFFSINNNNARYTFMELWELIKGQGFEYMYLLDERKHELIQADYANIKHHVVGLKYSGNVLCSKTPVEI